MIELVIGLLGLTFLWAYLYSKAPESTTSSGLVLRLLFLGMCFWTAYVLIWVLINQNVGVMEVNVYDENGTFLGKEIHNITISESVKNVITNYIGVYSYVIYIVFGIILIFLLYNSIISLLKR